MCGRGVKRLRASARDSLCALKIRLKGTHKAMGITLKTGELAYLDTFAGLVPCKVVKMEGASGFPSSSQTVVVKLTTSKGAYRRGEIIESNGLHVVARGAVYVRGGQFRIKAFVMEVA
jgi:hypothetical protein